MPKVSIAAKPNVAVVRSAHDVTLVGGSIIVHAHVPIDVHTAIDVHAAIDVHTSVYVRACMAATVVATTMADSSMAPTVSATVTFRIR